MSDGVAIAIGSVVVGWVLSETGTGIAGWRARRRTSEEADRQRRLSVAQSAHSVASTAGALAYAKAHEATGNHVNSDQLRATIDEINSSSDRLRVLSDEVYLNGPRDLAPLLDEIQALAAELRRQAQHTPAHVAATEDFARPFLEQCEQLHGLASQAVGAP